MADFRRWLYAFAVVALLAGLTIPASAQTNQIQCQTNTGVPPIVRAEAYADLVGDLVLSCTGGNPTPVGQLVAQANVTIFLTTNVTSKLLGAGGLFSEALLIIDDPNAPGPNSNRPILNCGGSGAPDNGPSGPGVCAIVSTGNPQTTYDGTQGGATYGSGRPNIFQGRPFFNGLNNSITFSGVPIDPPGTGTTRTLRITNIRADAELLGAATGIGQNFGANTIIESVSVNGNAAISINNPSQVVATIQKGLVASVLNPRLDFIQCVSENGLLDTGVPFSYNTAPGGGPGGGSNNNTSGSPKVRFQEGFQSSFKPRNLSEVLANGSPLGGTGGFYAYNGGLSCGGGPTTCSDLNQNVPGTVGYNTETGFNYPNNAQTPSPNPPVGIGSGTVTNNTAAFNNLGGNNNTGFSGAGVATQGTRLALNFSNIPTGVNIWVPPVIYLYRQGVSPAPPPTISNPASTGGTSTGVLVLTSTQSDGSGGFSPASTGNLQKVSLSGGNGLAVYEVLFADPFSFEQADIPTVVSYTANLSANPPVGLPVTGQIGQVTGGFAPFYQTASARLASATLPVPRFVPGTAAINLVEVNKCACNLLFPFVTVQSGFDTGIAVANSSLDPGAAFGFGATPQQGTITFFYFGSSTNVGGAPPTAQTSAIVPAGQVLTYDLFSGNGQIGNGANGLDNRANGFQGYVISQSQFQWCHGYAFISNLGNPLGGISEGYLGIQLDLGGLNRTNQASENKAH